MLKLGDVVLLVDDDLPRNNWLLGRVISVFPGADGLVCYVPQCVEVIFFAGFNIAY
jgi:hypothetical protein